MLSKPLAPSDSVPLCDKRNAGDSHAICNGDQTDYSNHLRNKQATNACQENLSVLQKCESEQRCLLSFASNACDPSNTSILADLLSNSGKGGKCSLKSIMLTNTLQNLMGMGEFSMGTLGHGNDRSCCSRCAQHGECCYHEWNQHSPQ